MKCRICGNEKNNIIHGVPERIMNNGAFFDYLECGKCKSWMLAENVNISKWYPKNYNVYDRKIKKNFRNFFLIHYICMCSHSHFPKVLKIRDLDIQFKRLCGTKINHKSKILDIGCANGSWLDVLSSIGFKNITGVDLYVPNEKVYKGIKWKFVKGDIFTINDKNFDLITLNHSFEHMEKPLKVLRQIYKLLDDKGVCEISIPIANGDAHREFGKYFCQLDAPRHIYVLDKKIMMAMCRKAGFRVDHVSYDSNELIYRISEGYKNTSKPHRVLMKGKYNEKYNKRALMSNKKQDGDQAIFYLKKQKMS